MAVNAFHHKEKFYCTLVVLWNASSDWQCLLANMGLISNRILSIVAYDCPAYHGVFEYAVYVAGASVKAAQVLMMGIADIAINWCGGWHHAKR